MRRPIRRAHSGGQLGATVRTLALAVVLLLGTYQLVRVVHGYYPVQDWLLWRYLRAWATVGIFTAACLLVGGSCIRQLGLVLPRAERVLLGFALGVYAFFLAMFIGGLLKWYGRDFAVALPLLLGGVGAWSSRRRLERLAPYLWRAFKRPLRVPSPWYAVLALYGVVGLTLAYLPILLPENASADARWYHLTLAEHYVAAQGIVRFPEGATVGAFPQLATVIYTWAFLLPATTLFDRVEIAAHLEFVLFLFTLAGVGVLAARVLGRRRIGLTWTAVWLFPGIFLYDSSLGLGADHVLAFWAVPIFLALLRALERLSPGPCLALGALLAGAIMTKYQAGCLVVFPAFALAARALRCSLARAPAERWRSYRGPLVALGGVLVLTAPHWAKNLIWYGDPFFPLLHRYLSARPWTPEATVYFQTVFLDNLWRPQGTLAQKLTETGLGLFSFSFEHHDWEGFHRKLPVFGSLFTLTSLCVPFLSGTRRLWGLLACTYTALAVWYWGSQVDRYLQGILPWMAAATAVTLVKLASAGWLVRSLAGALIGIQVIWGSDVPFFPAHMFLKPTPLQAVIDLFSSGYRRESAERLRPFGAWPRIGDTLPADSRVLVHGDLGPLGLGRMTVTDMVGWQSGISYGRQRSHAELHQLLRSLGVTHVLWAPNHGPLWCSLGDDLMFYSFVHQHTEQRRTFGPYQIASLPNASRLDSTPALVLLWGVVEGYAPGLYATDMLTVPGYGHHASSEFVAPLRAARQDEPELLRQASYLVADSAVSAKIRFPEFSPVMRRGGLELWVRNGPPSDGVAPRIGELRRSGP
jgi:hypothetical protein